MEIHYSSDYQKIIRDLQEEMADRLICQFFDVPAEKYRAAVQYIAIPTELFDKLVRFRRNQGLLRDVYLEPYFYLTKWYLVFYDDGGQLRLPFDKRIDYKTFHREQWEQSFREVIHKLSENGECARRLIRMCVNYGDADGLDAHNEFMTMLRDEYPIIKREPK